MSYVILQPKGVTRKPVYTPDGMKIIINTGHRHFDQQVNLLCDGQVVGGTQFSKCIRKYSETECNGHTFRPGHLRMSDIDPFTHYCTAAQEYRIHLPVSLEKFLNQHADEKAVLYEFSYYGHNRKHIIGYIVTDWDGNLVYRHVINWHSKNVIDTAIAYIVGD